MQSLHATARREWTRDVLAGALLGALTFIYACSVVHTSPGTGLDMDGWGHIVHRLKAADAAPVSLFREPSLWKGPVVPFVFGLTYLAWPVDTSVLYGNALFWAVTQVLLFALARAAGISRWTAWLALAAWLAYMPNRILFRYYFAEPVIALISALLLVCVYLTVPRCSTAWSGVSGAVAAVLLLARAPFALVVAGIVPLLWWHGGERRVALILTYILAAAITFVPWPVRNYFETGALIPFTTEGGMIVAQGTFLPGHGENFGELRTIPEWLAMEREAKGLSPVESYRYWQAIAKEQVREAPLAQLQLITRKFLLFWVFLYPHTWVPTLKTAIVAGVSLSLAGIGLFVQRRMLLAQMFALWIGGLWCFHTLIHAELRYNFPVIPLLFMLAAVGAEQLAALALKNVSRQPSPSPAAINKVPTA